MLPFFRKMRWRLAANNQFFKYSRYAVGEIVLVVIGILIALAINNWNEQRKEAVQEYQLLNELNMNLHSNILEFNKNIKVQQISIDRIDIILNQLENDKPYHDSLAFYFRGLIYIEQIVVSRSAYETLKSLGVKNIRSDSLRIKIIDLFEMTYPTAVNLIGDVAIQRYNVKQVLIDTHFRTNRELQAIPLDYEALKKDQKFINWLYNLRAWKNAVIQVNTNLIVPTTTLIHDIDKITQNKISNASILP